MYMCEEFDKAFNEVCKTFSKVIQESISLTEKQIGRPLTDSEKDLCVTLGVSICFYKAFKKGVKYGKKNEKKA